MLKPVAGRPLRCRPELLVITMGVRSYTSSDDTRDRVFQLRTGGRQSGTDIYFNGFHMSAPERILGAI